MSVIVNNIDITRYISQGGIQESTVKVYTSGSSASSEAAEIKGAHYQYTLKARMPSSVKDTLSGFMAKNSLQCQIDGVTFRGEMSNFSASVCIEFGELSMWDVNFTVSDLNLSDDEEAQ